MTTTLDLDRAIQAARGIKPTEPREYCRICDELLMISRRDAGLCWACQFRQEARDRRDYEEGA